MDIEAITDAWVCELATSPLVGTRRQLVREVAESIEPQRRDWLELLADDVDPVVAKTVARELSALCPSARPPDMIQFEEQFVAGVQPVEFDWEWEYVVGVWLPRQGPHDRLVFLQRRDDAEARHKAFGLWDEFGVAFPEKGGVFIKRCRLVCEYTRSPRTMGEAMHWKQQGRPKPPLE